MVDDRKQGGEELLHQTPKPKGPLAAREEAVLDFWNKEGIFEKSLQKPSPKGEFVFYDGPPFANGLPHYGHILASAIKDAIPRYRTMAGYHVPRQWGWDCHGLPVENLVEKELGLKAKRDIEEYGIEKFNAAARTSIMKDVSDWKRIIPRIGRWADMEHDYKTMDASYTASVWWAFKNLYDRGLAYEGFKAMHYCPRCGTTLSNFEVAQGYLDIEDFAVTVKLPLVDEPDTSLLIWTTTPWTLPGNTAAAVKADAVYVKVKIGEESVIVAKNLWEKLFDEKVLGSASPQPDHFHKKVSPVVTSEFLGKTLVGKKYLPPFDYFADEMHKHKTHLWRVYAADFVTLDSGTGIVHLAPAFGADDLALAQANKIPLIHHVTDEGKFIATVRDFAGLPVKPKGRHLETDAKIVEHLRGKGLLFKDEKVKHSYPHCWRCDTPLLNWAATSWFVNVQKIKGKLLKENASVGWVPGNIGEGRFGKWLGGARDWAVSRSRYWGAPVPVWRNTKSKEIKVVGSVDELLSMAKRSGNRYFVMRHGEALSNVQNVDDLAGDPDNHLTEHGTNAAKHAALDLKKEQIDLILISPFVRTRETASLVQRELGLPGEMVIVDERLREGGSRDSLEVRRRVGEFLFEVEQRYVNKNILIVSHGYPLWVLTNIAGCKPDTYTRLSLPLLASVRELPFTPFPHNANYELDLHRPYIDDFAAGEWKRDKDVFDCWFESGSMPFASKGYPLNKKGFDPKKFFGYSPVGYPADFIAEGLDQTRGWFYSLIVLGTALFGKTPYKNVIVNGIITASDGQKMSKRLKNYPDPMEVVEKYGADSLRYFLLSSPVVRAEDLRFNERGVEEVSKKLLMRLDNVRSFYDLHAPIQLAQKKVLGSASPQPDYFSEQVASSSTNVLDRWILSRLGELVRDTKKGFEAYELDAAARPLASFIDDLSTWYLRRSRDRFKQDGADKTAALATLRRVLMTTAQVMAPLMPFFADDLYRRLRNDGDPLSVHLCDWPEVPAVDEQLITDMAAVRALASQGLQAREQAGIKVRQPLGAFETTIPVAEELKPILADELNVKEIRHNPELKENRLDLELTPELKEEGMYRDYVRTIQEWRKEQKFSIADRPGLLIKTNVDIEFIKKYRDALKDATGLLSLEVKESDAVQLERL